MPRLFVLDAMGLAYRAYHALMTRTTKSPGDIAAEQASQPDRKVNPFRWEPLRDSRGEATNAIYGFANTVLKIRREEQPDYWALAWDGPGPTQRHTRFPDYKATRKEMPPDLRGQLDAIEDLARSLGLPVLEVAGLEADDVMATLACRGARDGFDVALVTSDKDLAQLVNDRVRLLSPVGRGEEYVWVDRAAIMEKWGVSPEQTRDVLALMGDTSDNIPGVPGVGPKTASELIREFGSLDALYADLGRVARPALRLKLAAHRELAFLSQELVTVQADCELPYEWEALRRGPIRRDDLLALARRYELTRLEKIAIAEGVGDEAAGPPPPGRSPERRGTAAETRAPGVKLTGRVSMAPANGDGAAWTAPRPATATPAAGADPADTAEPAADRRASSRPEPPPESAPGSAAAGTTEAQGALDLWAAPPGPVAAGGLAEWRERLEQIHAAAAHGLLVLPLGSGSEPRTSRLIGVALAARDGTTTYLPLGHDAGPNFTMQEALGWLAPLLSDPAYPKIGHDLKRDAHLFAAAGLAFAGLEFDLHIGSFLCDPDRDHGLAAIARDFLGIALPGLDDVLLGRAGRARPGPAALNPADVARALEPAVATMGAAADALRAQLESRQQGPLYDQLEHPLIPVLLEMERTGIRVDTAALRELADRAGAEIAGLEQALLAMAGEPVNLQSGQQLARVLFQTLKLAPGRRTRTGYSTDQAVLEELAGSHEFPARLLEYRALTKLKSTYLDALPLAVDPRDGRVHTTYDAAGAATGRLSSSNPNLQNIPIRTPQGRAIRRAFVAPPGAVLIGADYSQIELRLMAHLSGDTSLIDAFASGEDIHASTARRIFGITGELDPALRSRAKIVNFGIMYGMGARSLSQQMKIPLRDAQEFIRHYFAVFSGVREYLDRQLDDARRGGFVQTLLGRRRYLPALAGGGGGERSLAERVAINAPIQGSAADLMKLAMIRVHHALKAVAPSARLLLQVHDELVIESPVDAAEAVANRVQAEMEGCLVLKVPLRVSVGSGATWFDVH